MPLKFLSSLAEVFKNTRSIVKQSLRILKQDPQILIYPYLAVAFILLTSPIVNGLVIARWWHDVTSPSAIPIINQAPHSLRLILGLVTFQVFYAGLVTSYFTCALSAVVWAKLEGRPVSRLYGLKLVGQKFLKITKFALVAIFFFPLGIVAQYKKLPKRIFDVVTSSFSLHMPQLAPAILLENKSLLGTIRSSVDTLGKAWREGLIIRIGMFLMFILLGLVSLLPKLILQHWFHGPVAHVVGWIAAVTLGATSYVVVKVIGSVFTTSLYYQAKQSKRN